MNFISVLVTVWTIHLHYRSPKTHCAPPKCIQRLFFQFLPVLFLMRKPKRYQGAHQFSLRNNSVPNAKSRSRSVASQDINYKIPTNATEYFHKESLIELQELTAQNRKRSQNPSGADSIALDYDEPVEVFKNSRKCFDALEVIADSYKKHDYIRQVTNFFYCLDSKLPNVSLTSTLYPPEGAFE